MELVYKYHFPAFMKLFFREFFPGKIFLYRRQQFGILIKKFAFTVVFLVFCHRCVGSAMEFKIKLTSPFRKIFVSVYPVFKAFQKIICKTHSGIWRSGYSFCSSSRHFEMFSSRSSPSVTVSECQKRFPAEFFLLISVVCAGYHFRPGMSDVGGKP